MQQATSAEHDHGQRFLDALAIRDFNGIATLLHPRIQFRALTPPALREGTTNNEAIDWISKWLSGATEFDMIESSIDTVVDRLHLSYRIRLREDGEWFIVEQHAYCTIEDDQITSLDLVCSGFRPVTAPR